MNVKIVASSTLDWDIQVVSWEEAEQLVHLIKTFQFRVDDGYYGQGDYEYADSVVTPYGMKIFVDRIGE